MYKRQLAGVFAERSGIINLALEGIMVFGAFIGVWFVRILQTSDAILSLKQSGNWVALQGVELLTMLVAAVFGALFSLLLSFASINLRADQTIGGTALNLMAPALVLFFIRIIANQNTLQMLSLIHIFRAVAAHGLCPARLHRARVRRRQLL